MTIKHASSLRAAVYNGTHGNLSKAIGAAEFAADAANTAIAVLRLEAGTTVTGLTAHNAALGVGTGYKVGVAYFDAADGTDDDGLFATDADSAAAGSASYAGVPITFEKPVMVTVTATGATATGKVTVVPEYIYRGPN